MPYAVIDALDRQRARIQSERVSTESEEQPDLERGSTSSTREDEENSLVSVENEESSTGGANESSTQEEESPLRTRMTLAELEEERELFRRRSSVCVMCAIFFLFRLWVEVLREGDWGLLMVCLVGTSWTARWVRHNREREEELDRLIANYNERQQNESTVPVDMSMLSFQAQLALAIMESQRQMMEGGGYGHSSDGNTRGVSDAAKEQWDSFNYSEEMAPPSAVTKSGDDEEPHCSICLGEYETGEKCVKLPCGHVFHEECIDSWTANHTRCPLCNLDLDPDNASPLPTESA